MLDADQGIENNRFPSALRANVLNDRRVMTKSNVSALCDRTCFVPGFCSRFVKQTVKCSLAYLLFISNVYVACFLNIAFQIAPSNHSKFLALMGYHSFLPTMLRGQVRRRSSATNYRIEPLHLTTSHLRSI